MNGELDELRERITKLRESDRYLLIELILVDIRTQREEDRIKHFEAMESDIEAIRAQEVAQRKKKRPAGATRSEAKRAAG